VSDDKRTPFEGGVWSFATGRALDVQDSSCRCVHEGLGREQLRRSRFLTVLLTDGSSGGLMASYQPSR
jgi:hypothetical protein